MTVARCYDRRQDTCPEAVVRRQITCCDWHQDRCPEAGVRHQNTRCDRLQNTCSEAVVRRGNMPVLGVRACVATGFRTRVLKPLLGAVARCRMFLLIVLFSAF